MADLVQIDTDEEMDKYAEAELIASNPPPVSLLKNKKLSFNSTTRRNDVLASLSTGGYVKIGEEDISREDQVRQYSRELQGMDMPFDVADFEAAGFTAQEVEAAGVMPVTQEKSGRTEPLREGEQLRMLREGGDAAIAAPSRMFMRDDWNRGTVDVLSAIGVPAQQANQIADLVMGQVDTSGGTGIFDSGVGIIDFTPVGLAFGIEEIGDQLNRSIQADDKIGIGTGMLFMALSAAEAYPLTKAGAKAVKAQIPAIRQAIADLGQSAEERIAQEGTTLFSNPVGPAVDRGLAAAGRFLDAPRARSVDEFAELAASGKLRQARTTQQDISDITEKKMPATVIELQGADDELSIAYESGEITDQLTQAGLFVDDDQMGTIYVGTTQENLDAIKSAENPAEIGKLSGYSDADIAAFYLKRRGGDKKAAFQEYRSDLADARAKERDQIRQRSREQTEAPDTSYRMEHQPTGPEGGEGIRLDDLTKNISGEQAGYPDDFYTGEGMRLYAQGPSFEGDEYGLANQESYKIIASVRENPDAEVTIYRAVPDEDAITTINPGDFVTLSPTYAKLHAASGYGRSGDEAGKVLEETVKVRDIYWDGNDVNEFGYFPEEE
jgi:hypothetical protein